MINACSRIYFTLLPGLIFLLNGFDPLVAQQNNFTAKKHCHKTTYQIGHTVEITRLLKSEKRTHPRNHREKNHESFFSRAQKIRLEV